MRRRLRVALSIGRTGDQIDSGISAARERVAKGPGDPKSLCFLGVYAVATIPSPSREPKRPLHQDRGLGRSGALQRVQLRSLGGLLTCGVAAFLTAALTKF